eukprot:908791-Rhodomonas_salina.1
MGSERGCHVTRERTGHATWGGPFGRGSSGERSPRTPPPPAPLPPPPPAAAPSPISELAASERVRG